MPANSRSPALVVLFALIVIAGVGVAARVLLRDADAPAAAARGDDRVETSDRRDSAPTRSSTSGDGAAQRVELTLPAKAGASFASLDFKAGPADGFPIHVVDARDHQPLAGARVAVVAAAAVVAVAEMAEFEHEFRFETIARAIDADTRGYLADAHGIARVEWPVGPAWIIGEAADRRGARELQRVDSGDFELALARRRNVDVEVVDAHGVPLVGARVEWMMRDGDRFVRLEQAPVSADSRGIAHLERFERLDKVSDDLGVAVPWAGRRGVAPAVFVPFVEKKSDGTAEGDAATERLRCVVPGEFGTIAVRIVDAFGRLVEEKADLSFSVVKPVPAEQGNDANRRRDSFVPPSDSATVAGGSDNFAPVPLGLDLRLQVGLRKGQWARVDLRGPRKHGETVRADMAVQGARCRIRGRLVGATKPTAVVACLGLIPDRPWLALMEPRNPSRPVSPPIALEIAGDGVFALDANVTSISYHETLTVLGIDDANGDAFEAMVELPEKLTSANVDLGEVRVHVVAVVAAGRVLSANLKPLAGVAVQLIDWSEKIPTDQAGRFLFVGDVTGQRVVIHVDPTAGQADAMLAVEAGRRDLEIVLEREGEIAGSFVADHDVSLFAKPHGDDERMREVSPGIWSVGGDRTHLRARLNCAPEKGGGPFSLLLPPGRYDVLASLGSATPEVVARVDDVEVFAGRTTRDSRLDPLVLRGLIGKWRFTLERSDGAPPPSIWVRIAAGDHDDDFRQTLYLGVDGGNCDSTLESAWVDVAHPGFRHLHELHERGDVKLVLEPVDSHPLVVHVTVPRTVHDGELAWRVRVEPSWTPPVEDLDWFSAPLGADGTAHLDLDEGESWRIHVLAVIHKGDRDHRCEIRRLARTLRDDELTAGALELRLEPEDLEAATEELSLQH